MLLDTHTFLWFITASSRLSADNRRLLEDATTIPLLSIASVWEMAIKVRLGRLETDGQPFGRFIHEELARNTIALLDVTVEHADRISTLPLVHRDPFDHMLIAQAMTERVPIISADSVFDTYSGTRIW